MRKILAGVIMVASLAGWMPAQAQDSGHRFGGGVNYWAALDDVDIGNIDDNGLTYYVSYQYRPSLVGLQLDFELIPDLFGKDAYAPAAYVVVGTAIYVAAGIGIVNRDSEWAEDPFLALKGGLDLELLPSIYLDLGISYRFDSETELGEALDNIDTDTLFLGAAVRFGF